MTKIVDVREPNYGKLEVDEWVPFIFRAYEHGLAGPLYWTLGNETSLLEIKVERTTAVAMAVVLVACRRFVDEGWSIPVGLPETSGIPVVALEAFQNGHCKDSCDLRLHEVGDSCFVVIEGSPVPERCIRFDRVGFFEAQGELCAVGFFGLAPHELQAIHTWRSYQIQR